LFENPGDLNLIEITEQSGIITEPGLQDGVGYPSCWTDYDKDGFLDLLLTFRSFDPVKSVRLYRNNGDKTFTDVSSEVGISDDLGSTPLAAGFMDFNNDHYEDILIVQDYGGGHILLLSDQNGKFIDASDSSTLTLDDLAGNGMSATIGDINWDGLMDIYMTNTSTDAFFLNRGDGNFISAGAAIGLNTEAYTFGSTFFDMDCDSDLDLYAVRDGLIENDFATTGLFERTIEVVSTPTDIPTTSIIAGDFNGDGYPDLAGNRNMGAILYQNNTQKNNWLTINAYGTTSNYFAVGTRLILTANDKKLVRHIQCGQDFCSQQTYTQFFGLEEDEIAEKLTIIWPSGLVEEFEELVGNTNYVFEEGNGFDVDLKFTGYTDVSTCGVENPTILSAQGLNPPFEYSVFNSENELIQTGHLESSFQKDSIFIENGVYSIELTDVEGLQILNEFFVKKKDYNPHVDLIKFEIERYNCEEDRAIVDLEVEVGPEITNVRWIPNTGGTGAYYYEDGVFSYDNLPLHFREYKLEVSNLCTTKVFELSVEEPTEEELLGLELEIINPSGMDAMDGSVTVHCTFGVPPYTYLWKDAFGVNLSLDQSLEMQGSGYYSVKVEDNENCERRHSFYLGLLSDFKDEYFSEFEISPNPTNESIWLKLNQDEQIIDKLNIYNGQFQAVQKFDDFNAINPIDVSHLNPGLYFLEVRKGNKRGIKKLIIH